MRFCFQIPIYFRMDENAFKPGDHVVRRSHVHDEGIVLARAPGSNEKYFVIFAQRTQYDAHPALELLRGDHGSELRIKKHF